jgi:SSS family solute:Na+ symporter
MKSALDLAIVVAFLAGVVGYGCWFARRNRTAEHFTSAEGTLPGWAVGLSIFGSYISSISFLGNPGKAYKDNWAAFVFSLTTPFAAWVAVLWFVPFFRRLGQISAYEHLEHRFGAWARTYAAICFMLVQGARMGSVMQLLAKAIAPLLGVTTDATLARRGIVVTLGVLTTVYCMLGGIEAAVWTGVVQALMLILGALICLFAVIWYVPGSVPEIIHTGMQHDKFSLGAWLPNSAEGWLLAQQSFWVVLLFGIATNLQNFGSDQSYVQRYQTADSLKAAAKSVWLGAWLYVPVAALFFFIGTGLFAFYQHFPELLSDDLAAHPDDIFPHFIVTMLPVGLSGLVIAGIFAAGMDAPLNSLATLVYSDIYVRYINPTPTERQSLRLLRISTVVWGVIGTAMGIMLLDVKQSLDAWWELAGLFGGGTLGLFLLGLCSPKTKGFHAAVAVVLGVSLTLWMYFSRTEYWREHIPLPISPLSPQLTIVCGTVSIFAIGWLLPRLISQSNPPRSSTA